MSTTNPTHVITEWEELQIKHGNLSERPAPITETALCDMAIDFAEQQDPLAKKSLSQLHALEDDIEEDELNRYRQQRLKELKKQKEAYKFGDVHHIGKDEYVKQVTEASNDAQPVVILLYAHSPICDVLRQAWTAAAKRIGSIKFCLALGADVIPNFPDCRAPTVVLYKNGKCVKQWIGSAVWGSLKANADTIEWVLAKEGKVVERCSIEEDPRGDGRRSTKGSKAKIYYRDEEESEEDEEATRIEDDGRGYTSTTMERVLRLK